MGGRREGGWLRWKIESRMELWYLALWASKSEVVRARQPVRQGLIGSVERVKLFGSRGFRRGRQ